MKGYLCPDACGEAEIVEKRSRFIGRVWHVESEEEARARIEETKKRHYDARHNCWCYRIREGAVRYSDDGEPQGTAGQPMLNVFEAGEITDGVCVVTRYFGGVLLGTGGLLRAYTKSAKDALDAAGLSVVRLWTAVEIPCSYAAAERMNQELAACGGAVDTVDYGAAVTIRGLVPAETVDAFRARIFDISGGAVTAAVTGQVQRPVPVEGL